MEGTILVVMELESLDLFLIPCSSSNNYYYCFSFLLNFDRVSRHLSGKVSNFFFQNSSYSAKRATVSTRPRFLPNFLKIHSMVVQERCGNLKSRSRVNFKLSEKPHPSIKKCQKSVKNLCLVETVARFSL